MTTEKIEKIIVLLENAQRGNADFMECAKMIESLKNDASTQYAKENGKTDLQKALKMFLSKNNLRPALCKPFTDENGIVYATDSYKAIRIKNAAGLKIEKNDERFPDISAFWNDRESCAIAIEFPNLATLEKAFKRAKALKKKRVAVYLENGKYLFNAEYLKAASLATGSNVLHLREKQYAPGFVESENGNVSALLLPLRDLGAVDGRVDLGGGFVAFDY